MWLAKNAVGTLRAVKVVHRQTFHREEHFEREFRGLQKFEPLSRSHDGFVDILQLGRNDSAGCFYYVMELADDCNVAADVRRLTSESKLRDRKSEIDQSLLTSAATYSPKTLRHDLKQRGCLPLADCLQIGRALADALAHLHAQGLVHRDIKPSNIIFVNGAPKLADIGLVTNIDDAHSLVGTVGYIPPEGPGSPQADIYSLGKVLYEAAFGKDRQEFPQLPADLQSHPDHSALLELNEVIIKACDGNPRRRYQTVEEMRAEIKLLQRGKSVKRKRTLRQRWKVVKNLALLAIALALVGAGMVFAFREAHRTGSLSSKPQAESLYQRAVYLLQSQTPENAREAYTNLTEAVRLDPRFVGAYYKLFEVYFDSWGENLPPYYDRDANMRSVAAKLRELNPDSAEYYTVNCWLKFTEWRFEESIEEARHALGSDQKFARAHGFYAACMLRLRGDPELARREFEAAANLDGSDIIIQTWLSAPYYFERKFDRAIDLLVRAHRLERRAHGPLVGLARCYEATGQYEKAIDNYEACEISSPTELAMIKTNYAEQRAVLKNAGPRAWWQTKLAQIRQSPSPDLYEMARLCARLNETNEVFTLLERAYEERNGSMVDLLCDDCWYTLRNDQHFQDLVRRMGLGPRAPEAMGSNSSGGRQ